MIRIECQCLFGWYKIFPIVIEYVWPKVGGELDIQLYTALLHTESNKTKDLIRTSKEYSQILITSQQESFPIHRYNQTRLLFRSTHFLSPIQDTIHFEVPTGKISTTIRADPAPFSDCNDLLVSYTHSI